MKPGQHQGSVSASHIGFGDRFALARADDAPVFVNQFAADESLGRQDVAVQRDAGSIRRLPGERRGPAPGPGTR
jgi:hypothetical protein